MLLYFNKFFQNLISILVEAVAFITLSLLCKTLQVSSLLGPLVQLVKTGFTKAVQRLDGVYALLLVGKIAALDIRAGA